MELDVRLERSDKQAWGFRLIGGADYNFPLVVAKVQPGSLALSSGLKDNDVILQINGSTTSSMTHDMAYDAITQAEDTLFLGVARGLTSQPTMTEYQTMPMQDFVPLSQPYEVQTENRSRTASPFLLPAKPYRPFSTEPIINVPPIESPIILNPNYHDTFGRICNEDDLPETVFKLPISEQYVPDEEYRRRRAKSKSVLNSVETGHSEKSMKIDEMKYMEEMRKDIDINKIEETASQFIEESIEKAMCVTEEIKMEIDKELRIISSTGQYENKNKIVDSTIDVSEMDEKINNYISISKEMKTEINDKYKVKSSSNEMLIENLEINKSETLKSEKEEITENVQRITEEVKNTTIGLINEEKLETVRNNIELFEEKSIAAKDEYNTSSCQNKVVKKAMINRSLVSEKVEPNIELQSTVNNERASQSKISINTKKLQESDTSEALKSQKITASSQNDQTVKTSTQKNISSTNLLAEQRAYILGLQTIPNIRGHVQSSYQYDLLLKTFFIHLTDVMVALSRFILYEVPNSSEKVSKSMTEHVSQNLENIHENLTHESITKQEETIVTREEMAQVDEEITERKTISGSKMAQLSSRKSEEMTQKMDAVISEFQENVNEQNIEKENRTEIEQNTERKEINVSEHLEVKRNRRSRSRSQIEEKVAQESDPLDWLEKVSKNEKSEKSVNNYSETTIEQFKITELDTKTINNEKSTKAGEDKKISSSQSDKVMYLATVEAHVYTNPEALIEEIIDTSEETASIEVKKLENVTESNDAFSQKVYIDSIDNIYTQKENRISSNEESFHVRQGINVKTASNLENSIGDIAVMSEENETKSVEATRVEKGTESTEIILSDKRSIDDTFTQEEKCINISQESLNITQKSSVKIEIDNQSASNKSDEECVKDEAKYTSINDVVSSYIENTDTKEDIINITTAEVSQGAEEISFIATEIAEVSYESEKSETESKIVTQEETKENSEKQSVDNLSDINFNIEINQNIIMSTSHQHSAVSCIQEDQECIKQTTETNDNGTTNIKISETLLNVSESNLTEEYSLLETTETQESNFTAKLIQTSEMSESIDRKTLSLIINEPESQKIEINTQDSAQSNENNNIDTPTPTTVPPTPLTDEYVFRLQLPLPKSRCNTPAPREPTPPKPQDDHEDPHIVKKKLIPHIETTIESIVYDNIVSPNATNTDEPAFSHGLDKGTDKVQNDETEDDLLEIEMKSSLLASAIDDTIKSIEMYKQEISADKNINALKRQNLAKTEAREKQILINTDICATENQSNLVHKKETLFNGDVLKESTKIEKHENIKTQENNEAEIEQVAFDHRSRENTNININGLSNTCAEYSVNNNEANKVQIINSNEIDYEVNQSLGSTISSNTIQQSNLIQNVLTSTEENVYKNEHQEVFGTTKGIINGIESELNGEDLTQELGKPGMTEDKIAELISGESEMLREAHVMGLQRVLASHINRTTDDSSVDFQKIKPTIESLRDSAVLKALNEELAKSKTEKKAEERKWTTFLQTPRRPVPRAKFGHYIDVVDEKKETQEGYKVKIIKQPKPKVAPDYKAEDFETGPLPWEERAAREPPPPPVAREHPILVPEEVPQYLEAVDPLPESAVPDLEDTGIPLPPEKKADTPELIQAEAKEEGEEVAETQEVEKEELEVETEVQTEESVEDMEQNKLAEQILVNIQSMVDPNASIDQQLVQMRAQLAALAQLPGVIQKTLELVTKQLTTLAFQDTSKQIENHEVPENGGTIEETAENVQNHQEHHEPQEDATEAITENGATEIAAEEEGKSSQTEIKREEVRENISVVEEQNEIEKKRRELMVEMQQEQESRQLKQRPTPRAGRPKPAFGPLTPQERPMVLPGGRKWRTPKDAFNDEFIAETLTAQAEIIQGKAKGLPYESAYLPYDERVNFMKYEKPPVSLDHLKNSDVYKLVHNMDESPMRRVDMLTSVVAESDYREKCRSVTPSINQ